MRIVNLRIKNFYEQIGIDRCPVVTWEYDGEGSFSQIGYRIKVRDAVCAVYDSGFIADASTSVECRGIKLCGHSRYFYRVEVRGDDGSLIVSDEASFVTGVIDGFSAEWISSGNAKAFYAARRFEARAEITEAFCSVCGLGQFVLTLNGKKVGDHVLDPGWTDYNRQVQYVTFDVTDLLHRGVNDILAEIGCGWYIADVGGRHFYTWGFHGFENFGRVLPFIFEMTVRYADGTEEKLVSNGNWSVRRSPTTLSNIYGSEDFDARLMPCGSIVDDAEVRSAVVLGKDDVPKGEIVAMSHPPVKIMRTYDVVRADERDGAVIYDFGQNMSGLFEITVQGSPGQRVKMTPVEKLTADGDICQSCDSYLIYTLGGEYVERWRPQFTYSAGRWVKVECLPAEGETDVPKLLDIKAHFITTSACVTGKFSCSDERFGQIMNIIERAMESNLNHVHTDCPTVERLGWMETSHLMAPSAMYFRNVETLWEKILRDARETQYAEGEWERDLTYTNFKYGEGMITSVAPRYARFVHAGDMGSFWDIVPWGSTVILAEMQRRRFYGESSYAEDAYEAAKRYLRFLKSQYDEYSEIYGREENEKFLRHGLGDWGVLRVGTESRENVETAFFYHDLDVMAKEAERLGFHDDADYFRHTADEVKDDYNRVLLTKSEETGEYYYRMYGDTEPGRMIQTVHALPLFFGMVPEDKRASVEKSFLRSVSGRKIESGEIGLRYILRLLGDMDKNDIVYDMMMQPEHPSYIRFIEKGETTLPEYWEDDARSHNHDMMGHIYEWFYACVAGITSGDGFRTVRIAPRPPRVLTTVECSYHAVTGLISESLTLTPDSFRMELTLPPNVTATVEVPAAYSGMRTRCDGVTVDGCGFAVGGGKHTVMCDKI